MSMHTKHQTAGVVPARSSSMRLTKRHLASLRPALLLLGASLALSACGGGGGGAGNGAASLALSQPGASSSETRTGDTPAASNKCNSLKGQSFGPATIVSAELTARTATTPEHCSVLASKTGRESFQMVALLPTDWTGGIVQGGGGGFDGVLPNGSVWTSQQPLDQGMAFIGSNGGHQADPKLGSLDASALTDPESKLDWSYRAIGTTYEFGKLLVSSYYSKQPGKSYFFGCSKGGSEALAAASHFPENYDGIIAQAPAVRGSSFISRVAGYGAMTHLSNEKWQQVYDSYVAKCDAMDGLTDGVVTHRSACNFDPKALGFLTSAELNTVQRITSDLRTSDGTLINPGYWWGPQAGGFYDVMESLGDGSMRDVVLNDKTYDPKTFTIDLYWPSISAVASQYMLDTDPRAVANFVKQGKKLLVYMGGDDPALSVDEVTAFQHQVESLAGVAKANTQMYLLPGVGHCGQRDGTLKGAESSDMLGALRDWVEQGVKPTNQISAHLNSSSTPEFTRPLCALGTFAKYMGSGDATKAESFACVPDAP